MEPDSMPDQLERQDQCRLKSGSIWLDANGIAFQKTGQNTVLSFGQVADTVYATPFLLLKGKLSILTKDGRRLTLRIRRGEAREAQSFKHVIDSYCGINAYEESTQFARSPYMNTFSFANMLTIAIVLPLVIIHMLIGVFLCFSAAGVVIGTLIILSAVGILYVVMRSSMSAVEGKCPICGHTLRTSRHEKFLYCAKCKEKIQVKKDYFEF